jgi:hypothetical protein
MEKPTRLPEAKFGIGNQVLLRLTRNKLIEPRLTDADFELERRFFKRSGVDPKQVDEGVEWAKAEWVASGLSRKLEKAFHGVRVPREVIARHVDEVIRETRMPEKSVLKGLSLALSRSRQAYVDTLLHYDGYLKRLERYKRDEPENKGEVSRSLRLLKAIKPPKPKRLVDADLALLGIVRKGGEERFKSLIYGYRFEPVKAGVVAGYRKQLLKQGFKREEAGHAVRLLEVGSHMFSKRARK